MAEACKAYWTPAIKFCQNNRFQLRVWIALGYGSKLFQGSKYSDRWSNQYQLFFQVRVGLLLYCLCMLSCFSCVRVFAALWTVAHQDPLSMRFSRQEYWSGLPCPPPGDLPDPEIKAMFPASPALQKDSLPTESPGKPAVLLIL